MRVAPAEIGEPIAAERAEIGRSTPCGAVATPPTALCENNLLRVPPAQRRPSPKIVGALTAVPWRSKLVTDGSSPEDVRWTVSAARLGTPEPVSTAPPVPAEF